MKKLIDWLSHDLVNWKEPMSKVITSRELMYKAHKKRKLRANNSEKNNYNSIETATDQYV